MFFAKSLSSIYLFDMPFKINFDIFIVSNTIEYLLMIHPKRIKLVLSVRLRCCE